MTQDDLRTRAEQVAQHIEREQPKLTAACISSEGWPRLIRELADRLAALEHERDEALNACATSIGEAVARERDLLGGRLAHAEHEREPRPEPTATSREWDAAYARATLTFHQLDAATNKAAQIDVLARALQEHAEAALLSLQTAVRGLKHFTLPMHGHSTCAADPDVVKWDDVLALLPDTAGTQSPKTDDDRRRMWTGSAKDRIDTGDTTR